MAPTVHLGQPQFTQSSPGTIRIQHAEVWLANVSGNTESFISEPYTINPTEPNFPWLRGLATKFETYTFHQLKYYWVPNTGTNYNGTVMLAVDIDSDDTPPTSKTRMSEMACKSSGPCYANSVVTELSGSQLQRLVKERFTHSAGEPLVCDVGRFYYGMFGCDDDVKVLGDIYVAYDITLRVPEPSSTEDDFGIFSYVNDTNTFSYPFGLKTGTITLTRERGNMDLDWADDNDHAQLVFPATGDYLVLGDFHITYTSANWSDQTKCMSNIGTTFSLNSDSSGCSIRSGWLYNDTRPTFNHHSGGLLIHVEFNLVVTVTSGVNRFALSFALPGGAGLSGAEAFSVNLVRLCVYGYDSVNYPEVATLRKHHAIYKPDITRSQLPRINPMLNSAKVVHSLLNVDTDNSDLKHVDYIEVKHDDDLDRPLDSIVRFKYCDYILKKYVVIDSDTKFRIQSLLKVSDELLSSGSKSVALLVGLPTTTDTRLRECMVVLGNL
jgi:hypothetical protein